MLLQILESHFILIGVFFYFFYFYFFFIHFFVIRFFFLQMPYFHSIIKKRQQFLLIFIDEYNLLSLLNDYFLNFFEKENVHFDLKFSFLPSDFFFFTLKYTKLTYNFYRHVGTFLEFLNKQPSFIKNYSFIKKQSLSLKSFHEKLFFFLPQNEFLQNFLNFFLFYNGSILDLSFFFIFKKYFFILNYFLLPFFELFWYSFFETWTDYLDNEIMPIFEILYFQIQIILYNAGFSSLYLEKKFPKSLS